MKKDHINEIISYSSVWVAALLNFLPGLGTGYIYQHRWKAYWITFISTVFWIVFSSILDFGNDPSDPAPIINDQISIYGIFIISIITSVESIFAARNSRKLMDL